MIEIKIASKKQVYNLPLFELFCVVDIREQELFNKNHIQQATCFPITDKVPTIAEIFQFFQQFYEECGFNNYSPLIFYSHTHDDPLLLQTVQAIASFFNHDYSKQRKSNTWIDDIYTKTKEIWILQNGFEDFRQAFPFLCGTGSLEICFPLCIVERLYMGARSFQIEEKSLSEMKITHLILDSQTVFSSELRMGVTIFNVCMEDNNNEKMEETWRSCADFIDEALANPNHNILVQLHGRSRSASIIMAWLILKNGCTYSESIEYLKLLSKVVSIDFSLVYPSQLSQLQIARQIKL